MKNKLSNMRNGQKSGGIKKWEDFVRKHEDVFRKIAKSLEKKKHSKK